MKFQFGCCPLSFVINLLIFAAARSFFFPTVLEPEKLAPPLAVTDSYQWRITFRGDVSRDSVFGNSNDPNGTSFKAQIEAKNEFATIYELIGNFGPIEIIMGRDTYYRNGIVGVVVKKSYSSKTETLDEKIVGTFKFLDLNSSYLHYEGEHYYQGEISWDNDRPSDSVLVQYVLRR